LLSLNFPPGRVVDFFVYLVPPAAIIFIITYIIDPEAIRLGGYASGLIPFMLLCCILRLIQSFSILHIGLATACALMLVISMSRTPILMGGLGCFLAFTTIARRWRIRGKLVAVFSLIGVLAVMSIVAVPELRLYAGRTIARTTYQDVVVGHQFIEAELPDVKRWTIYRDALALYEAKWLYGIGYMNFMPWFGDMYDFTSINSRGKEVIGMNLHNVFQTWALEGGLPCLIIVSVMIWKYFSILRRRIRQSQNDTEKGYYKLFVIGMVCLLVGGLFHQIHQTPMLFIFLGIVYALDDKNGNRKVYTSLRMGR
jgi:O-antigen ligase